MRKNENAEEWMDHLRIKANEYSYKEKDRKFKEQFPNGINDYMMTEIIMVLTATKKTNGITGEEVLS